MTTIKELAQRLNLATSTVSRALAGHVQIADTTAKRVKALAKQLDYQPNATAVGLRTGRHHLLGVMTPRLADNFFGYVLTGMEQAAAQAGYQLLVCQSGDNGAQESRNLEDLLRARVAGVLLSQVCTSQLFRPSEQTRRHHVPLVVLEQPLASYEASAAMIDNRAGAYYATRHLLQQGYRRVAHVAGPPQLAAYRLRRLGYEDALRERGLPVSQDFLITTNAQLSDGVAAARQLLSLPIPPDAFFAANDFVALGILRTLREQHLRVPDEVGLVGFGNELFAECTEPPLTSLDQPGEELGRAAVQLLLQLLQTDPVGVARHVVLQPKLLVRASSLRQPFGAGN